MCMWLYWTISEVGVWGFLMHNFGAKGGFKGAMELILAIIFFFVGVIEIVSILVRPVSLSLRLFGNVFAGETLLSIDDHPGTNARLSSVGHLCDEPNYSRFPSTFSNCWSALLQALVFTLLCAVYIQLSTSHDEEEEH